MKKIHAANELDSRELSECIEALQSGQIICYPTETFYALGVDASNASACAKLYAAKKRDVEKDLPAIAADKAMVAEFCETSDPRFYLLAEKYWPGPLTIALPSLDVPGTSIAVRVSSNKIARQLSTGLGRLLISTSANFSGQPPAQQPDQIDHALTLAIAILVDAGACPGGLPSTIVSLLMEKTTILREGAIPASEILSLLASK